MSLVAVVHHTLMEDLILDNITFTLFVKFLHSIQNVNKQLSKNSTPLYSCLSGLGSHLILSKAP